MFMDQMSKLVEMTKEHDVIDEDDDEEWVGKYVTILIVWTMGGTAEELRVPDVPEEQVSRLVVEREA